MSELELSINEQLSVFRKLDAKALLKQGGEISSKGDFSWGANRGSAKLLSLLDAHQAICFQQACANTFQVNASFMWPAQAVPTVRIEALLPKLVLEQVSIIDGSNTVDAEIADNSISQADYKGSIKRYSS